MKKMFCLIIFLLTSNIYSVEVASAVATPAKKKNWEENIAPVIDGDLETHWEKKCDYKRPKNNHLIKFILAIIFFLSFGVML